MDIPCSDSETFKSAAGRRGRLDELFSQRKQTPISYTTPETAFFQPDGFKLILTLSGVSCPYYPGGFSIPASLSNFIFRYFPKSDIRGFVSRTFYGMEFIGCRVIIGYKKIKETGFLKYICLPERADDILIWEMLPAQRNDRINSAISVV